MNPETNIDWDTFHERRQDRHQVCYQEIMMKKGIDLLRHKKKSNIPDIEGEKGDFWLSSSSHGSCFNRLLLIRLNSFHLFIVSVVVLIQVTLENSVCARMIDSVNC